MIRQAPLRSATALLLVAVLSSCDTAQRPTQPSASISHAGARPTGFQVMPLGGGIVADNQVVVVLDENVHANDFLARYQLAEVENVTIEKTIYRLLESQTLKADDLLELLKKDPEVVSVFFNRGLQAPEYEGQPMSFDDQNGTLHSAEYAEQDQLSRIRIKDAHDIARGAGVRVAVLDTGIDAGHPGWGLTPIVLGPDFSVLPHRNRADETADLQDGDGDGYVDEAFGHGTHVAGIVHLTAPEATLIAIKVLDDEGWGSTVGLAAGIMTAVQLGANIINLSLGLTDDEPIVEHAISFAASRGIAVVASAGNKGSDEIQYPASYHEVFSVTAVDSRDFLAHFANYNTKVAMSAPGVGVISLIARAPNRGEYAMGDGTSMAAPFLCGATALLESIQPQLDGLHAAELVVAAATPIDELNPEVAGLIGRGRVDLRSALPPAPPPPSQAPGLPLNPVSPVKPKLSPTN